MIKNLSIRNYALIDQLDFSPSENLSMITGETGAGKSIMLGALGLLMGNRADTKVLWDESTKCKVEAQFDLEDYNLKSIFEEYDLDYDHETIIRREISPSGKSRAFINDTPVTLEILRQIGGKLMDIHSQHESLQLNDNIYQLDVLDSFAQHFPLQQDYFSAYQEFCEARSSYEKLLKQSRESAADEDYKRFILQELIDADLNNINQEELENELSNLEHAEEIKQYISQCDQLLDQSEISIQNQLKEVNILLRKLVGLSNDFQSLFERLDSTLIELKDIHGDLQVKDSEIIHNPQRMEEVRSQLDELIRLQKKHQVTDRTELVELRDQVSRDLEITDNLDAIIEKAKTHLDKSEKTLNQRGARLRDSRIHAAKDFSGLLETIIREIGIENGRIEIEVKDTEPTESGMDHAEILFSANKGIPAKELKSVASGGEFSRLIFAIKYLIADKTALPTIFFDEIDTGVSGEIAIKMVKMMRKMAQNHQVISISHLPQFAAGGDRHFFVFKNHQAEKTVTKIRQLTPDERIEEIAKMIGGNQPTQMAFENARELLTQPT